MQAGGLGGPIGRTSDVPEGSNKLESRQNVRYDENEMVSQISNSVRIFTLDPLYIRYYLRAHVGIPWRFPG